MMVIFNGITDTHLFLHGLILFYFLSMGREREGEFKVKL